MNFNNNDIPSERVFNASKPSSSQLEEAFILDTKNTVSDNTWIYEWLDKLSVPKNGDGDPKKKSSPFKDGNSSITSPRKIIRKRGPPPEDTNVTFERQKKRRIDVAPSLKAGTTFSNGLSPTIRGPRITDLLPIQRDSWLHLPEMWEYRGPDGRRIRKRRWSPSQDGDDTITHASDRLQQNSDRNNATATTVATWVELNRLRARYQELVAEFHGGPLVVHHLADRKSEEQLTGISLASAGLEKAMAGVGRAAPSQPRLSWAVAPALDPIARSVGAMSPHTATPIFVSPLDTLLLVTPVEEVVSEQAVPALTTPLPVSTTLAPPEFPEPSALSPAPAIPQAQLATLSNGSSSTKATKRRLKVARILPTAVPPSVASTSSDAHSFISTSGQFRFTVAGETLFKLLAGQGKYDEAFAMLPAEQQFEHLTAPDAIAEFTSTHPLPNKGGKGKNGGTGLWVCKAKVRLERKELPRANKGDAPEYELEVVYSDVPCNGAVTKPDSVVRHKKRTHLGRQYQWNPME